MDNLLTTFQSINPSKKWVQNKAQLFSNLAWLALNMNFGPIFTKGTETPINKPNNPPQLEMKWNIGFVSMRLTEIKCWSLNRIVIIRIRKEKNGRMNVWLQFLLPIKSQKIGIPSKRQRFVLYMIFNSIREFSEYVDITRIS